MVIVSPHRRVPKHNSSLVMRFQMLGSSVKTPKIAEGWRRGSISDTVVSEEVSEASAREWT